MTDNSQIGEMKFAPVPEFVILRLGYHNLRNTLPHFAEPGWSIAEEPREIQRQRHSTTYDAVLKHDESGRYFRTYWRHVHFRDEIVADPICITREVFPREVTTIVFETESERREATNEQ